MPTSIAATHPAAQPVQYHPDHDRVPDVPEYAFSELWQDRKEGLSFGDFLDIVNPLQHIPVVSTIYRMVTGDEIGIGSRLAGGALYGGPIGAAAAGLVAIFEGASGKTVEQHVAALFDDGTGAKPDAINVAASTAAGTGPAPAAGVPSAPVADGEEPAVAPRTQQRESIAPAAVATVQGAAAPPATAATKTATETAGATAPQPADVRAAAERQRIAKAIEQAQRAQAGLLLASLQADDAASQLSGADKDGDGEATTAGMSSGAGGTEAFRAHPYMLPPGAPPQLISRAMEQALNRYQSAIQQRDAGTAPAAPRTAPAPVR